MTQDSPVPDFKIERVPVAAYARMSTISQRYSIANQLDALQRYAAEHRMVVVQIYRDEGRSGLRIKNRPGLTELIADIENGQADFKIVLVYDVTRWGRFQDVDESAHYEFLCRTNGVNVTYCAEPFENDGSLLSTLAKVMKRGMAAEYSRELAAKVSAGHCRGAKLGRYQGALPGFGLRRLMIDENGQPVKILNKFERKSTATSSVTLAPGPPEEVALVRSVFRMYLEGMNYRQIAIRLNAAGPRVPSGRPWRDFELSIMLRNERYAGNYVYCRQSNPLAKGRVLNAPEHWIRAEGVFEPVIDADTFRRAQEKRAAFRPKRTDAQLLETLREYVREHGSITHEILDAEPSLPGCKVITNRFGTLSRAYSLIGFDPWTGAGEQMLRRLQDHVRDGGRLNYRILDGDKSLPSARRIKAHFGTLERAFELIGYDHTILPGVGDERRKVAAWCGPVMDEIVEHVTALGLRATTRKRHHKLWLGNASVVVRAIACRNFVRLPPRWRLNLSQPLLADWLLLIRADKENRNVLDYHLIPKDRLAPKIYWLSQTDDRSIERFRIHNFEPLYREARQSARAS